ncbi:MAG: glycerophosphodiester phosphodiesterase family protein [Pedobacter sp.]|uniref:glycerophosphodiester phosphodiesterase family protein n=1 Tax=Pedobacter sp. TaxID=1411316 RepID=UPI002808CFD5|nr:glycerophosphodiester phosphodiesterase family protein [Pedobacter sp.]MDQ8005296.1 glycerophosphodiester phosphodiesterase family protein [Pedobacter sp.]
MKKLIFPLGIFLLGLNACSVKKEVSTSQVAFPSFSAEAHRGGRGLVPENTVLAMRDAMTYPAVTTLEMDTHITKDGKVVVTHDDYLSPGFMLTPDGKEIPSADAKKYNVFQMNYNELKTFDIGTKFHKDFPQQKKIKTYIPLLADLIDSVQTEIKTKNKKQYFYNIETKCSAKGDGVSNPTPAVFVKLLMDVIKSKKIEPYVVVQSFDKRTIQIINKEYPNVKTSFLVSNKKSYEENIADLGYKPFIISPAYKMVDATFIKKAHADGVKVIPWTVNTAEEIAKLKALGIDGIITDYTNLL